MPATSARAAMPITRPILQRLSTLAAVVYSTAMAAASTLTIMVNWLTWQPSSATTGVTKLPAMHMTAPPRPIFSKMQLANTTQA